MHDKSLMLPPVLSGPAAVPIATAASPAAGFSPSVWKEDSVFTRIHLPLLVCYFGRVLACFDACVLLFYKRSDMSAMRVSVYKFSFCMLVAVVVQGFCMEINM